MDLHCADKFIQIENFLRIAILPGIRVESLPVNEKGIQMPAKNLIVLFFAASSYLFFSYPPFFVEILLKIINLFSREKKLGK